MDSIVNFAEGLLNVDFRKVGENRYTAYRPFHHDNKDSFRVYADGKDDIRFHCFGACENDWDIYDIIKIRNKCSFREAQMVLAEFMTIKGMVPYVQNKYSAAEDESEPDEPVTMDEPKSNDQTVHSVLKEDSEYYGSLLLDNQPLFEISLIIFKIGALVSLV